MTDAEHAAVLRRYQNGDASTLVEMRAAIERAIELLEMDIEWVDGIPLMLIAKKKKPTR